MQTTTGTEILLERKVAAAPAEVYRAFTRSYALREWLCDFATAVARSGGRLYVAWNVGYYAAGTYTGLQEDREVAFTWLGRDDPGQTQVRVTLSEQGDETQVTLVHSGFGQGEVWEKSRAEIEHGWQSGLDNLVSVVGSGPDLRITRRPMMGLVFSDFTPEIAKNIGVPVSEGMRLENTLEGLGARKAGLLHNDVIVELEGQPIKTFDDFGPLLSRHQAGDTIKLGYYRGQDKREVEMVLAPRPLPEIPATPAGLAAAVQKIYDEQWSTLQEVLSGVSEEEADFHPGEKEWNIKEVLSHLILNERANNEFIYEMVSSGERYSDAYGDSWPERMQVVAKSYPILGEVLADLQRAMSENIRVLEILPVSLLAHKGTYWRLAYAMLTGSFHLEDHREQIESAIKAARA
jgi:uncharacterized protein YndB with AHSA1/START domain